MSTVPRPAALDSWRPDPRSAVDLPTVPGPRSAVDLPLVADPRSAADLTAAPAVLPLVADPAAAAVATLELLEAVAAELLGAVAGPLALLVALAYSFLVAFLLPLPGELVLAVSVGMGLAPPLALGLVVLVSSAGKALGSLAVLHLGRGTALPVVGRLRSTGAAPARAGGERGRGALATVRRRLAAAADRYGHLGLTAALAVPFAPDTAVLYAFSAVESDRGRFAAAAFVGTAVRLSIVAGLAGAVLAVV